MSGGCMPIVKNWTICKECNRVLFNKDADKNGLCEDCAKPEPTPKAPKADKEPKEA